MSDEDAFVSTLGAADRDLWKYSPVWRASGRTADKINDEKLDRFGPYKYLVGKSWKRKQVVHGALVDVVTTYEWQSAAGKVVGHWADAKGRSGTVLIGKFPGDEDGLLTLEETGSKAPSIVLGMVRGDLSVDWFWEDKGFVKLSERVIQAPDGSVRFDSGLYREDPSTPPHKDLLAVRTDPRTAWVPAHGSTIIGEALSETNWTENRLEYIKTTRAAAIAKKQDEERLAQERALLQRWGDLADLPGTWWRFKVPASEPVIDLSADWDNFTYFHWDVGQRGRVLAAETYDGFGRKILDERFTLDDGDGGLQYQSRMPGDERWIIRNGPLSALAHTDDTLNLAIAGDRRRGMSKTSLKTVNAEIGGWEQTALAALENEAAERRRRREQQAEREAARERADAYFQQQRRYEQYLRDVLFATGAALATSPSGSSSQRGTAGYSSRSSSGDQPSLIVDDGSADRARDAAEAEQVRERQEAARSAREADDDERASRQAQEKARLDAENEARRNANLSKMSEECRRAIDDPDAPVVCK